MAGCRQLAPDQRRAGQGAGPAAAASAQSLPTLLPPMSLLVDTHCHLDQYTDPYDVAAAATRAGVAIVAVTGLPSHFASGVAAVRGLAGVRLAVGLHPLLAPHAPTELASFARYARETSYIGEVGLDFSRHGRATRESQERSFAVVLDTLQALAREGQRRFVTLHSRGAERALLDMLGARALTDCVLHWYSGPSVAIDDALALGCYFSVNPAMVDSASGRRLLERVPPESVLLESDGPYVKRGDRPVRPDDLPTMLRPLGDIWGLDAAAVAARLRSNLTALLSTLRLRAGRDT